MDGHRVELGDLDRPRVHDACTDRGQLEHLVVLDVAQLARRLHHPGVGGEDAVDVGVDLARLCAQRRGQGDGRGVGSTPSEGRDLELLGHALETGHHGHLLLGQGVEDAIGLDVADTRARMVLAGADPGLRA